MNNLSQEFRHRKQQPDHLDGGAGAPLEEELKRKIRQVEENVGQHFGEHVLHQVKIGLATAATSLLQDCQQPITVLYVGGSGSSKTTTCNLLMPDKDHPELSLHIVRVDKFTPKSFVTHVASVKAERLPEIDLLPKIENKCLVTKELAPLFRGRTDDLEETFSTLIAILDGKGFTSASGIRGIRGYNRDLFFAWLGATTPLSNRVHQLMAQLGTRLVFYNTETRERSEEELLAFARRTDTAQAETVCRSACNDHLKALFESHQVKSIPESFFQISEPHLLDLVRHVQLMCFLRAGFEMKTGQLGEVQYSRPDREVAYRAIIIFKNLAFASALIHGRNTVNDFDLQQIRHIAYSSMPEQRRILFQVLLQHEGHLEVKEVSGMSKPTALRHMKELSHLGVCDFQLGDVNNTASSITLAERWKWLIDP